MRPSELVRDRQAFCRETEGIDQLGTDPAIDEYLHRSGLPAG